MKDIITGLSLMWLLPSSIIITDVIIYNLKIGVLKERNKENE